MYFVYRQQVRGIMAQAYPAGNDETVTLNVTILHGVTGVTSVQLGSQNMGDFSGDFELSLGIGEDLNGSILKLITKIVDAPNSQGGTDLTGAKYELSRGDGPADYINEQTETVMIDQNTATFSQTMFFMISGG
jgi:hypothetical protein